MCLVCLLVAQIICLACAERALKNFYLQYFKTLGVAEAELEQDVAASICRIHYSVSGDGPDTVAFGMEQSGKGFLDNTLEPETLPTWLREQDIEEYAAEFSKTRFRGGLNGYRNLSRSWEWMTPWRGQVIHQASLFIAGECDDVYTFPHTQANIDNFSVTLPDIRGCHILSVAGHRIQRERAATVNKLLIEFLDSLQN